MSTPSPLSLPEELVVSTPLPLTERGGSALQWESLRTRLAAGTHSPLGRRNVLALEPSADLAWITERAERTADMRRLRRGGEPFEFRGVLDPTDLLDEARIGGAALEPAQLLRLLAHATRTEAWRELVLAPPDPIRAPADFAAMTALSAPLLTHDLRPLLRSLEGKIEPDGTLADNASPELARLRSAMGRQHRAIQESLRRALSKLSESGAAQEELITVRGERFVIPVKAEFKRRVGGVIHGSSSTGGTVFVEPFETIEQNNELTRLLDEEQAEIHRILVAMTAAVAAEAPALLLGAAILGEADAHQSIARFADDLGCVPAELIAAPPLTFSREDDPVTSFELDAARHPLLELRLREERGSLRAAIVPLTLALPPGRRQMIISGPNTGGKTVALKTAGLLALMAQCGVPVPARSARLPLFTAIYTDIGDAQSIEANLSTFSAHITNVARVAELANDRSLVLLDELGSATDPDEGSALAVAVAGHFLARDAWSIVTTHLTSLKVYAAQRPGVLNAAVGFNEETLAPTYDLRLGVPGASAGINIAARLGLPPAVIADARANLTTQQADIGRFLDELHAQLTAAGEERSRNAELSIKLQREREHLAAEGRREQQARTRELERQLQSLIADFESQLKETVRAIDDKTVAQKIARDSALRIARLRREFSEQFASTVTAHTATGEPAPKAKDAPREPRAGDLVRLKSLNGREGRIVRVVDARTLEVSFGAMKTRVPRSDVLELTPVNERADNLRRGSVSIQSANGDDDSLHYELNVIGQTADEAEAAVDRFVERAFLAGLPRIRIVHGVGMGVLRRTLRDFLRKHPHVTGVSEPPYNEGGQGATLVELRS